MATSSNDVHLRLVNQARQDIMSGVLQATHGVAEEITPGHLISHACRLAAEGRLPYDIIAEALQHLLEVRGCLT